MLTLQACTIDCTGIGHQGLIIHPGDSGGIWVFDEVIGYSVAMVSRPCLSAKLHLKLALSDSGNRDWDADHVGGAFPAP